MGRELRTGEHKERQLEDRMTGREGKWEKQRREERKLIISSSLYKPISESRSLRQHVLKNITALTEGPLYSMWCCNYNRIWAKQYNNYCCTVRVSSSKPVLATNHYFHLGPATRCPLSNPNMRRNMSLRTPLSHVCAFINYTCACLPVSIYVKAKQVHFFLSTAKDMCLCICLSNLQQYLMLVKTCGGVASVCFKNLCVWQTEDWVLSRALKEPRVRCWTGSDVTWWCVVRDDATYGSREIEIVLQRWKKCWSLCFNTAANAKMRYLNAWLFFWWKTTSAGVTCVPRDYTWTAAAIFHFAHYMGQDKATIVLWFSFVREDQY